ncbi:MAG TPA: helix-turn-helix domain-containing protein [Actinomycetales bacterium]|nr:helix-turn-helix domain-containing protein [Actinomycetales bacterium]
MSVRAPAARPRGQAPPPGVRRLFAYAAREVAPRHTRPPHRGLPSSTLTVIVATDSPLLCSATADEWASGQGTRHEVCLGAFHLQPVYLQRPDLQEGVQVALHPLAARRLFGLPAAALTGLTQEGDAVLGPGVRALHRRVASAAPGEREGLVAHGLAELAVRHERTPAPRREVVGAWRLLERAGGRMRVGDVADGVGLTPRHLSSLVKAELGIGTKQLADLFRWESAHAALVRGIRSGRPPLLADLAHTHGYADHAHLDAAYRRYAGTSPSSWIGEEFRNIQAGGDPGGRHSEP